MTDIFVGEGPNRQRVKVSDNFFQKTPAEQQSIANDIAKQLGVGATKEDTGGLESGERWRRTMLPVDMKDKFNPKTQKYEHVGGWDGWRVNVGGFVSDLVSNVTGLVTEPIEAIQAAKRGELDLTSEEGIEKMMPTVMAITGLPTGFKKVKPRAPGTITAETREAIQGTKIGGEATATKAYEGYESPPSPKNPAASPVSEKPKPAATVTDAEIEALFAQADYNVAQSAKPAVKPKVTPVPESPAGYARFKRQISGETLTAPGYENITEAGKAGFPKPRKPDMRGRDVLEARGAEATGKVTWQGEAWNLFNQFSPERRLSMQKKQAAKILWTAKAMAKKSPEKRTAFEKAVFLKEIERQRSMSGWLETMAEMPGELQQTMVGSVNAISALDDVVKAQQFVKDLDNGFTLYAGSRAGRSAGKRGRLLKGMDMAFELFVNGLLSGPQTQTINALSNSLVKVWEHTENVLAAGIGKVAPGPGMTAKEVWARMAGDMESVGDALRAGKQTFMTETPLFEDVNAVSWLESRSVHRAIPGRTGRIVRLPGRGLSATDSFFKLMAYRQTIAGLAMREANRAGLTPVQVANRFAHFKANPTAAMKEEARHEALRQTFNLKMESQGAKYFQGFLRNTPAKFIVPFYQTPVNLLKYSFERVPIANLTMRKFRDDFLGRNGSYARNQAHARTVMGGAVMGWIFHEAMKGNVTGFGPSDPAERSTWRGAGNQPYSGKVGEDFYSFSRLEPLGTLFGIAADAASIWGHVGEEDAAKIGSLLAASVAQNLSNKTWLRGPIEFAEAVNDPERYGYSWAKRQVGSLVPTGLAQYARVQDPYIREVNTMLDAIKERIPGLKETLQVQRGVFGEPLKSEGGLGPDLITPLYTTHAKNDPTIAEMLRLRVFPGALKKKINGTELTAEEWGYYTGVTGKVIKKFADAVVRAPQYKELPDAWREKLLTDIVRKAGDMGRIATKVKFSDLQARIEKRKAAERLRFMQSPASGLPQPPATPLPPPTQPPQQPQVIPTIPGQT